jgi:preprotein translocase subunit SecF
MKPIYKIMFGVSMVLMLASAAALASYGLNLGVDFRGGSVLEMRFKERPATESVITALSSLHIAALKDASVNPIGDTDIIIKSAPLTEAEHQSVLAGMKGAFPTAEPSEVRFDSIGPAIGQELARASIWAIVVSLLAIALYIAIMFRTMSRTLSPWVMSLATMVALAHDVLIPLGVFAVLGHFAGVEISEVFVAAILTIMGYSISDTVVVFDRVRENIVRGRQAKDASFGQVVHQSIMQTIVRSINTNITTLLSLVAIYFFGGSSIRSFALALIIGIFSGAYSSIFVASPLLVWMGKGRRRVAP